ncbi:serine/threonine-protein kinase [Mycobacterium sp. BK086]|uniref:hypothetical protein n=1 Tax=Mycobacterium sp. BK086 TaxID=2512165 RepID=UPI0010D78F4A|nr:hypothetical protein [Mycobacterium sp. BK086]TDO15167.1 serine/threonine-protein kinase [Mycobacterium sp. BK086]
MTDEMWLVGGGLVADSSDAVQVRLGAVIARAGEGTVSEVVGHPEWVAKIFHDNLKDRALKCAKVAAMVHSPPAGAVQSDGFVVLTWPLHVVANAAGPAGYVMRRIDTTDAVEIHTVSNPSNRANPLATAPQWTPHMTWLHLVNVAANLCLAVEVVHRVDAVIGDFQERNILVNNTTQVTLVDCDSMQFTDAAGRQFMCGVGRPEFTAPELAGLNLAVAGREKPSDLFALAVHIHLLLMAGNHPFLRGTWAGPGDQPDALTLAKSGWWAGGPGSPLHTHPLAPAPGFLPDNIQRLFQRAFTGGARNPEERPTAHEWRNALQGLQIRTCVRGHQLPVETEHCPWCHIEHERTARRTARPEPVRAQQPQTVYVPATPTLAPASKRVPTTTTGQKQDSTAKYLTIAGIALATLIAIVVIVINLQKSPTQTPAFTPSTTTARTFQATSTSVTTRTSATTSRNSSTVSPNALNVSVPMSHPPCDGSGIVVLANAVTPGRYDEEVQRFLNSFSGSSYLRTDESCPSLRKRDDAGNPIYAVYRPAGRSDADICAAVRAAGGDAYGKRLDTTSDPTKRIQC